RRAADAVAWACPEFRDEVEAIAREVLGGLEDVALSPVHGDRKPDHVCLDGDRVTLVDLASAALGHPTRHAARLYAYPLGGAGLGPPRPPRIRGGVRVVEGARLEIV